MALLNGDIMSEIQLRQRIASAKAVARNVPVTTLTGFTVEQSEPISPKVTGFVELNDCFIIKCDACGESFTVPKQGFALVDGGFVTRNYGLEDIKFCAKCGVKLGDE